MFKQVAIALSAVAFLSSAAHSAECDAPENEAQTRTCIGDELRTSDQVINDVYKTAMASRNDEQKAALRTEQRAWLQDRNVLCGLDKTIVDREVWIQDILRSYPKTLCVVDMTRKRISTLQQMLTQSASASHAAAAASNTEREQTAFEQPAYGGRKPTIHSSGKWYFEFTLNRKAISAISPTLVMMGVSDKQQISGTMVNVTGREADDSPLRVGVAADLDHGKIYTSRNGDWSDGRPGSNEGADLKLGRDYYSIFMISTAELRQQMLDSGAFVPNFGDDPFAYAMPDGYRPWRNRIP